MKTFHLWISIILSAIIFNSCGTLKAPTIIKNESIEGYKYVCITPTKELSSSVGVNGMTTTRSVNPSDIIAGELIKRGFIIIPELKSELNDKTLIINYGESGRRNNGFGYTIEVTLQFISASSNNMVCTCTAEGQGSTEADDIRQAIRRALSSLFQE